MFAAETAAHGVTHAAKIVHARTICGPLHRHITDTWFAADAAAEGGLSHLILARSPRREKMETLISDFRGPHHFLSNFHRHPVRIGGDIYPTAEHAYQALKAVDPVDRAWVLASETPLIAKRRGRKIRIVEYWADVRLNVMEQVLAAKFADPGLANRLVATRPHALIEGNTWHDSVWGICYCPRCPGEGDNELGKLLMALRDELR